MQDSDSHFSSKELNKLIAQRRRIFLIGIPSIICLLGVIFYLYAKGFEVNTFVGAIIVLFTLLPIVLIGNYSSAVTDAAYDIIADNTDWEIYYEDSKFRIINYSYQNFIQEFGLLPESGHVKFQNHLEGEIENRKFILQDISWVAPKRTRTGKRDDDVARYSLLITDNTFQINCNILIKKNTILKWGIKKLERIKIEDKEFEKYYDVYTDAPAIALGVLNPEFIKNLMYHKKVCKNMAEILITPETVFVHQKSIESEERLNWNIFIPPMELCRKKIEHINSRLNILQLLNLLNNK